MEWSGEIYFIRFIIKKLSFFLRMKRKLTIDGGVFLEIAIFFRKVILVNFFYVKILVMFIGG